MGKVVTLIPEHTIEWTSMTEWSGPERLLSRWAKYLASFGKTELFDQMGSGSRFEMGPSLEVFLKEIKDLKILFVLDGMKTGIIEPGSLSEFNLKNYSGFLHLDNYHDVPFREIISLGKTLDMSITGIIHIIGIEIQEDKVFDRNLSPPLQSLFPELVNRIHRYIDKIITLEKIHSENETF
jgi:Ni,Fe-hydrogenase maturation factor